MTDMRFDTEKMVERLEDAGVPPAQARTHVALLLHSIDTTEASILERCASKQEVSDGIAFIKAEFETHRLHIDAQFEQQRLNFEAKFEQQRLSFDAKLADTRAELMKWGVTVGILQIAFVSALVLKLVG